MFDRIPFSEYCDSIGSISHSTRTLATDFRSAKRQIAECLAYDSTLATKWAQFFKDYESAVDDSRAAAAKLSAIINMYTSLLGAFQKASTADVVHELGTFKRSTTSAAVYDFGARVEALQNAIAQLLNSLPLHGGDDNATGSQVGWVSAASTEIQAAAYHLLLTPLVYVGGVLAPSPTSVVKHGDEQNRGDIVDEHAFNKNPETAQDVLMNMRNIWVALGAQRPRLDVFQKIADALLKEFEAYTDGLNDADKTPQSPANVDATHAAAASRAEEWKKLARVLTNEYARA